jgi:hypothetical protein
MMRLNPNPNPNPNPNSSTNKASRKKKNDSFPWLKSLPGNKFFLVCLPNITEEMISNALCFISNKCFHYDDLDIGKNKFIHLPGISVKKHPRDSIPLEKLLKEAVHGKEVQHDDFRFQTPPNSGTKLLKSRDVKDIYSMAEKSVQGIDKRFSVVFELRP